MTAKMLFVETQLISDSSGSGHIPRQTMGSLERLADAGVQIAYFHDGSQQSFRKMSLQSGIVAFGHGSSVYSFNGEELAMDEGWFSHITEGDGNLHQNHQNKLQEAVGSIADKVRRVVVWQGSWCTIEGGYSQNELEQWRRLTDLELGRVIVTDAGLVVVPYKAGKGSVAGYFAANNPESATLGAGASSDAHEFLKRMHYPMAIKPFSAAGHLPHEFPPARSNRAYELVIERIVGGRPGYIGRTGHELLRHAADIARNGHVPLERRI